MCSSMKAARRDWNVLVLVESSKSNCLYFLVNPKNGQGRARLRQSFHRFSSAEASPSLVLVAFLSSERASLSLLLYQLVVLPGAAVFGQECICSFGTPGSGGVVGEVGKIAGCVPDFN